MLVAMDTILQVDLLREVHLVGDGGEDESLLPAVGHGELNLAVQSARSKQGGVQRVGAVRRHDHLRRKGSVEGSVRQIKDPDTSRTVFMAVIYSLVSPNLDVD